MWLVKHIWSTHYPLRVEQNIELRCTKCGKIISFHNAIGKIIKPCECKIKEEIE